MNLLIFFSLSQSSALKLWHKETSHISCVCLVSAIYNPNLQLQNDLTFVVVLWLCNVL